MMMTTKLESAPVLSQRQNVHGPGVWPAVSQVPSYDCAWYACFSLRLVAFYRKF